jgi:hypothetical protein
MIFGRTWAMPRPETFSVPPIREFVLRYLSGAAVSLDPFARSSDLATHTNDLDRATSAQDHMDAEEWLKVLWVRGVKADVALFDPPYSPRQLAEAYQKDRRKEDRGGSRNAALYKRVRDALLPVLTESAVVLSFGWNTAGMGTVRGFEPVELLVVYHGAAHNDTLCLAERRVR